MPRARIVLVSIVLAAAGTAAYWLARSTDTTPGIEPAQTSEQVATREALAKRRGQLSPAAPRDGDASPVAAADVRDEAADCLSPAELDSDPVLAAEYARLDAVITSGPTIASYRGLSASQLHGLAVQGDSAAMAMLGAVAVMRAAALPEDKAVAYLLREEPELGSFTFSHPLEQDAITHLEEARGWFYRSALNGRLLALRNAGDMVAIIGGSPTDLGWVDEDEYARLDLREKIALDAAVVYEALAFEIAPQLRSGPFGEAIAELTAGGERQQAILDELAWQFEQDREAARLPPIAVPESAAPSMRDFEASLCEPYLDSFR